MAPFDSALLTFNIGIGCSTPHVYHNFYKLVTSFSILIIHQYFPEWSVPPIYISFSSISCCSSQVMYARWNKRALFLHKTCILRTIFFSELFWNIYRPQVWYEFKKKQKRYCRHRRIHKSQYGIMINQCYWSTRIYLNFFCC